MRRAVSPPQVTRGPQAPYTRAPYTRQPVGARIQSDVKLCASDRSGYDVQSWNAQKRAKLRCTTKDMSKTRPNTDPKQYN